MGRPMWQLLLLLSSHIVAAAVVVDSSRVAFFWQSNDVDLQTKSDYEYVYQQWKNSLHPGYLVGGSAYIMDMDTGKLELTGASGQRVESIGFSVWKEMGLKVSAMIYIYDYKLSSPTAFINSAIAKMKTYSLDGFHLEYRPTPSPSPTSGKSPLNNSTSNRANLNSFMEFVDQFATAMHQVNPHSLLSLSGGTCPSHGQFTCTSASSVPLAGYLDEGYLGETTAERFKAIESHDQPLGNQYWPAFTVDESLGKENWSKLLTYLGQRNYTGIGTMSPKNLGLQPEWYLDEIVNWLNG